MLLKSKTCAPNHWLAISNAPHAQARAKLHNSVVGDLRGELRVGPRSSPGEAAGLCQGEGGL